jgi:hypothetical protein
LWHNGDLSAAGNNKTGTVWSVERTMLNGLGNDVVKAIVTSNSGNVRCVGSVTYFGGS